MPGKRLEYTKAYVHNLSLFKYTHKASIHESCDHTSRSLRLLSIIATTYQYRFTDSML